MSIKEHHFIEQYMMVSNSRIHYLYTLLHRKRGILWDFTKYIFLIFVLPHKCTSLCRYWEYSHKTLWYLPPFWLKLILEQLKYGSYLCPTIVYHLVLSFFIKPEITFLIKDNVFYVLRFTMVVIPPIFGSL